MRAAEFADPRESELRTRRLIARALPLLLIFFVALAIYDAIDGDWFGTVWAAVCLGVALVCLQMNRRWLSRMGK